MVTLRQVNKSEEGANEAYWREHFVDGFNRLLDDKAFVDIENALLSSINFLIVDISVYLMDEAYGYTSI